MKRKTKIKEEDVKVVKNGVKEGVKVEKSGVKAGVKVEIKKMGTMRVKVKRRMMRKRTNK